MPDVTEIPWKPDRATPDRVKLTRPLWRRIAELPRAVGEFVAAAVIVGVPLAVLVLLGDILAAGANSAFRPSAVAVPVGLSVLLMLGFGTVAAALGGGAQLEIDPRDGRLSAHSGARRLLVRVKAGTAVALIREGCTLLLRVRTGNVQRELPLYAPAGSESEVALTAFAQRLAERARTPLARE